MTLGPGGCPRLFITGTDTGVGKTRVTCALVAALWARGVRAAPFKPVETGCRRDPASDELIGEDGARLAQAAGGRYPVHLVGPVRLEPAASPAAAAALSGRALDEPAIARALAELGAAADLLLIEGAGGLLAPYAGPRTMADLARELGAPLLVVARTSLGTVNHTRLTLEAAGHRGLTVVAVVLNQLRREVGIEEPSSRATIEAFAGAPVYGPVPFQEGTLAPGDLAAIGAELAPERIYEATRRSFG